MIRSAKNIFIDRVYFKDYLNPYEATGLPPGLQQKNKTDPIQTPEMKPGTAI
jgi:hypothetical protein